MPRLKPDDFVRLIVDQITPQLMKGTVGVVRGYNVEHGQWKLEVEFFPPGPNAPSVRATLDPSLLEEVHESPAWAEQYAPESIIADELAER